MELVGRTVKKTFEGLGTFFGIVDSYDSSTGVFNVLYEDGEPEALDYAGVASILELVEQELGPQEQKQRQQPPQQRRRGRKPKKRRRGAKGAGSFADSGNSVDMHFASGSSGWSVLGIPVVGEGVVGNLEGNDHSEAVECAPPAWGSLGNAGLEFVETQVRTVGNLGGSNLASVQETESNDHRNAFQQIVGGTESVSGTQDRNFKGSTASLVSVGVQGNSALFNEPLASLGLVGRVKVEIGKIDGYLKENPSTGVGGETKISCRGFSKESKDDSCLVVERTELKYHSFNNHLERDASFVAVEEMPGKVRGSDEDLKWDTSFGIVMDAQMKNNYFDDSHLKEAGSHGMCEKKLGNESNFHSPDNKEQYHRKRRRLSEKSKSAQGATLRRSSRRAATTLSSFPDTVLDVEVLPANNILSDENLLDSSLIETEKWSDPPAKLELPPSSNNLDINGLPVLDVFSVYACLRSFSTVLFLSPFSLEDFVTALKCNVANSLIDSIHVTILRALKLHLESLGDEVSESASICLRSINWSFLDLITWPVYLVEYLIFRGSGLKSGVELRQLKLLNGEYYKQSASVKLEILRCLCDDVVEVENIRLELIRRTSSSVFEMENDRTVNNDIHSKRIDSIDDFGNSCVTEEVGEGYDPNSDECCLCRMDGSLICCDGCPAAYHSRCVGVAKDLLPEGDWYCPECVIDKHDGWQKSSKPLQGAELLGKDPHGRVYFASGGYLLVSNSDDTEQLYYYYNKNDLGVVLEALKSSDASYSSIKSAISQHWGDLVNVTESKGDSSCQTQSAPSGLGMEMGACVTNLSSTFPPSLKQGMVKTNEVVGCKKSELGDSNLVNCEHSEAIGKHDSASKNQSMDITGPLESSEGSAEMPQANKCPAVEAQGNGITYPMEFKINDSVQTEGPKEVHPATSPSVVNSIKEPTSQTLVEPVSYVNFYSFGWFASSVVQELSSKSSNGIKNDPKRSAGEIISSQVKAIAKKSVKFCWPEMQKLDLDSQREKCGWCFSCKNSSDEDCLFNRTENKVSNGSKVGTFGLGLKRNWKSHLFSVKHYILSIEDRLRGLLAGPWEKPYHRKQWRTNILQAPDVASVKPLLLTLELNLRRIALSTEWLKSVDTAVTVGSASHLLITSDHVSSKRGGRKWARKNNSVGTSNFVSSELGTYWWRGGRLSRQVFHWKVLPRSMVLKAGRQGGCRKIPGISYPDGSEFSKRCKCIAWRAAVEMSTCVPQLAYQVRELDANIKWSDILNPQLFFPVAKESKKLAKPLTKVTIRRKCIEGTEVKYLVDFGMRKSVPDIVTKHGVMLEESSNERKKFWLNESYVPLKLLKAYEEKKQALTSSKASPGLNHPKKESKMKKSTQQKGLAQKQAHAGSKASPGLNHPEEESKTKKSARQKALAQNQAHKSSKASSGLNHREEESKMKKSARPKGLSHLFSRAEKISAYCCGHCSKDVIAREAVSCQICKGFFHREHARLRESTTEANCAYVCYKCQDNKGKIKSLKVRSGGQIIAKRLKVVSRGSGTTIKLRAMQSEETKVITRSSRVQEENDKSVSKCRKKQSKKKKTAAKSCGDQSGRTAIGVKSNRQRSEKTKATVKSYSVKPELVSIPELRRSQRSLKKASYVPAPVQSTRLSVSEEGNKVQSKRKMPVKPKAGKSHSKGKRTSVPHAYWLQGLLWRRKGRDKCGSEFQEKKVLSSSKPATDTLQHPVCGLCHEQYDLKLTYIACESCEDWFHGDAFGVSKKNVNNLLGFKCHTCLKKKPPVCPYSRDALDDRVQFHDKRNQEEGIVSFKDLSEDGNSIHVINAARSPSKEDYLGSCGSEEPLSKKRRTDCDQSCKLEEVPSIFGCHDCEDKKSLSFEVVGEERGRVLTELLQEKEEDGSKDNPVVAGLLDVVTTFSDGAKLCMATISS